MKSTEKKEALMDYSAEKKNNFGSSVCSRTLNSYPYPTMFAVRTFFLKTKISH